MTDKLLLTYIEVAHRLGVGRTMIWKMLRDGELTPIRIGRSVRFSAAQIERWVEAQTESRR